MKRLVAAACLVLLLNNFSKSSAVNNTDDPSDGQRVLVKAIAVIVNTESNKKLPAKRIFISAAEPPLY